jgi:hypothetical protein
MGDVQGHSTRIDPNTDIPVIQGILYQAKDLNECNQHFIIT